nr:HSP70-like protein [Citrus associated ampelovirus 1]
MEVGIDFGTTYSTVCYDSNGVSGCLPIAGSVFVPTVVFIPEGKTEYYIGNVAHERATSLKGRLYVNLKRWVGATKQNINVFRRKLKNEHDVQVHGDYDVRIGGIGEGTDRCIRVTTLIFLFLKALITEVESAVNKRVDGFVCSVPADYNSFKRGYLAVAAEKLQRNVRALVNEPTSAALFSMARSDLKGDVVSVFDFGGGTFDVSILVRVADIYCVMYSIGDNYLGGRDVDRAIIEVVYNKLNGMVDRTDLLTSIQGIKEDISSRPELEDHLVQSGGRIYGFKLTHEELAEISLPFIQRAISLFTCGLKTLGNPSTVVVLTGGSSSLPGVDGLLGQIPCVTDIYFSNRDYRISVAAGAKVYSDILCGGSSMRLIDTLTHSLSDELSHFTPKLIFPKGCVVPNKVSIDFGVSGSSIPYGVMEGESNISWLNEMTFKGIHSRRSSARKSDKATYAISIDGRLSLSVDGDTVENIMKASEVEDEYESFQYQDGLQESYDRYLKDYTSDISELYDIKLTLEDLEQKIDSGTFNDPKDLLQK